MGPLSIVYKYVPSVEMSTSQRGKIHYLLVYGNINWCETHTRCIEGVHISESPLGHRNLIHCFLSPARIIYWSPTESYLCLVFKHTPLRLRAVRGKAQRKLF